MTTHPVRACCYLGNIPFLTLFLVNQIFRNVSDCSSLHPDADDSEEMNFGLDMGQGADVEESSERDEAFIDGDVEALVAAQAVDSELELSEVGRVRSDFVNDSRFKPY